MSWKAQELIRKAKETNAEELDLSECGLIKVPAELKSLTTLKKLRIWGTSWDESLYTKVKRSFERGSSRNTDIKTLGALKNLAVQDLSDNNIYDLSPLSGLSNLQSSIFWNNQVTDLSALSGLSNLQSLGFQNNRVTDLGPLSGLSNLQSLDFWNNQVADLRPLRCLSNLKRLGFSGNQVTDLGPLSGLSNLESLDLSYNRVTDLTPILLLPSLIDVHYAGNPIQNPPPEIAAKGLDAMRKYIKEIETQGEDFLREVKLLIVGEPGAGKTSLRIRMNDRNAPLPAQEATTRGIDIDTFKFRDRNDVEYKLNVWDFGGQQIYYATHQFFLTHRSVYFLVEDTREENTNFNYWLQAQEALGGNSPIIIVQNEKGGRTREIDYPEFSRRYSNLKGYTRINLADNRNLDELIVKLKSVVLDMPIVNEKMPKKWVAVRRALEKTAEDKAYISLEEYLRLCNDNGISDSEKALFLSDVLHDLGIILHFKDSDLLKKTVFLQNTYVTDAVYKIIDDKEVNDNNGKFTYDDTRRFWSETRYSDKRDELLGLLKKFEMCYEAPGGKHVHFIFPQLLKGQRPENYKPVKPELTLKYKYAFLPKGHFSRFIVRTNRIVKDKLMWRTGIVLEREKTTAEIIENYEQREIVINVSGANIAYMTNIITYEFDNLNEGIKGVDILVPCICGDCRHNGDPYFFEYSSLKKRLEKGKDDVECGKSYDRLKVIELLEGAGINRKRDAGKREYLSADKDAPVKIFISYAHEDGEYLDEINKRLRDLQRNNIISGWTDTKIVPGMNWDDEIKKNLHESGIVLFLLSPDFKNSDYIYDVELRIAMQRHERGEIIIVPIALRPDDYSSLPLTKIHGLPDGFRPVSKWEDKDEAYLSILNGLKKTIAEYQRRYF